MEKQPINYEALLADFNLFLSDTFGSRDAASLTEVKNGQILTAHDEKCFIYIRLWENSVKWLPNMSAIIVQARFKNPKCKWVCGLCKKCDEYHRKCFEQLLYFLQDTAPLYGFHTLALEAPGIDILSDKTEYGFTPPYIASGYNWQIVAAKALIRI